MKYKIIEFARKIVIEFDDGRTIQYETKASQLENKDDEERIKWMTELLIAIDNLFALHLRRKTAQLTAQIKLEAYRQEYKVRQTVQIKEQIKNILDQLEDF